MGLGKLQDWVDFWTVHGEARIIKPVLKGKLSFEKASLSYYSATGAVYTDEGYLSNLFFTYIDFQEVPQTNKNICIFTVLRKNFLVK